MIIKAKYPAKNISDYRQFVSEQAWTQLQENAKLLVGQKIIHLNATPIGGGPAEIFKSMIPLQLSLGLDSEWYYLEADPKLFEITKALHNSLQGADNVLSDQDKEYYLDFGRRLAPYLRELKPDILVIHDPQPLAAINDLSDLNTACRIHIDATTPNPDSMSFIEPMLAKYGKVIFTCPEYVPAGIPADKVMISAPAIDPLSDKNSEIYLESRTLFMKRMGLDPDKRLVTQVARFDPWKDPLGVIEAFTKVKKQVPDIQLVMSGIIEAQDDPEAYKIIEEVKQGAAGQEDVHLFYDIAQLKDTPIDVYVSNLQASADVVFQKSTREGFGMSITEAMWKSKPVVAGNVAGPRLQIVDGVNGFLVDSIDQASERLLQLLNDKALRLSMGEEARQTVKEKFLITRLIKDEMDIYLSLRHQS